MANYVLLDRIELNATAASVTFDNIPQTGYTDLKIVMSARVNTGDDWGYITFNGSSSNWSAKRLYGTGSSALSQTRTDNIISGIFNNTGTTASTFNNIEVYIPNYASSNYKSISIDGPFENNATAAQAQLSAYLWSNTAAITSIAFTPGNSGSFVQYSTFSLYGVAKLGTTPAIAPKADGGNVIGTDGTYWYHAFLSNGTFTPQVNLTADVMILGAGGGGGSDNYFDRQAGGGGAGGIAYFAAQSLAISTGYTCVIGAGGAAGIGGTSTAAVDTNGKIGTDSQFASLTVGKGGGYGGGHTGTGAGSGAQFGSPGGSGGGNSTQNGSNGSNQSSTGTTAIYGNAGGGSSTMGGYGGGGGGTGAAAATTGTDSTGGIGTNAFSSWLTALSLGVSGRIGGGGGGWGYNAKAVAGGTGGGGVSGTGGSGGTGSTNSGNGLAGTGSGGGASHMATAGTGGSGIVIIRYPIAS